MHGMEVVLKSHVPMMSLIITDIPVLITDTLPVHRLRRLRWSHTCLWYRRRCDTPAWTDRIPPLCHDYLLCCTDLST